jgi:hypothetical protein
MRVSTRYVPHIVLLALGIGAAVWRTWLAPERPDPCAHPDVLSVTGLIPGSRPTGERRDRLSEDVIQWSEGTVVAEGRPDQPLLTFRIVRSYNVLKVAEKPLHLMPHEVEPESLELALVDAPGGPLPVHVVRTTGVGAFQVVAYSFLYGNEPVSHPLPHQLRKAWQDPFRGQRPLTVILAGGPATPETAGPLRELALRWITSAWQHYRIMCLPETGSGRAP